MSIHTECPPPEKTVPQPSVTPTRLIHNVIQTQTAATSQCRCRFHQLLSLSPPLPTIHVFLSFSFLIPPAPWSQGDSHLLRFLLIPSLTLFLHHNLTPCSALFTHPTLPYPESNFPCLLRTLGNSVFSFSQPPPLCNAQSHIALFGSSLPTSVQRLFFFVTRASYPVWCEVYLSFFSALSPEG